MKISLLKDGYVIAFICLALTGVLFLLDYWLPAKNSVEIVTARRSYAQAYSSGAAHMVYGIVTNKEEIPCTEKLYGMVGADDSIFVSKTPITRAVISVGYHNNLYTDFFSIYNGYCLFPTILFLTSAIGLVLRVLRNDYYMHAFGLAVVIAIYLAAAIFMNRII